MRFHFFKFNFFLILLLVQLSAFQSFAFAPDGFHGEEYWKLVTTAAIDYDLPTVQHLLENPPPGSKAPLSPANGLLMSSLYGLLIHQDNEPDSTQVYKLIKRSYELGADPIKYIPFQFVGAEPDTELQLTAIDYVLERWLFHSRHTDKKELEFINTKTTRFLDLAFASGLLKGNYLALLRSGDNSIDWRRLNMIQWSVFSRVKHMRDYFLQKVDPHVLDKHGLNAAAIATLMGDLNSLKKFREVWGPDDSAQAFNYRLPNRLNPTILHLAVASVTAGVKATEVARIIDFLTKNGADPTQRSSINDLIGEVDFWESRHFLYQQEFQTLRKFLLSNMARLSANYLDSLEKSKPCDKILGTRASRSPRRF